MTGDEPTEQPQTRAATAQTARRRMLHDALDACAGAVRTATHEQNDRMSFASDVDALVALLPRVLSPRVESFLVELIDAAVQRRVYGAF